MSDGVPTGWSATTLGEVALPSRPRVLPRHHPHLPFIGMEHIEAHTMRLVGTAPAHEMKSSSVHVFAGDVLYGRLRPYLNKVHVAQAEALCSAEFIVFPADTPLNPAWLAYLLNSGDFVFFASHLPTGDRPRVDYEQVATYDLLLPPRPEQDRILAEIEKQLTRLDAAVAALRRAQANLKRYRAAVLKAACEGRLVPTEAELARKEGRAYETSEQLLARILKERRAKWEADQLAKMLAAGEPPKDDSWKPKYKEPEPPDTSSLPRLPPGWTWATAEQLSDETRAITYGVIKLGEELAGGVSTLRSSDVRNLRLNLDHVKRIDPTIAAEYQRTFLSGGEILVTVRGTLGGVVVVPETCRGFNVSREVAMLALVRPETAACLADFIASPQCQAWLLRNTSGIAYTGVNIERLKQLPIPVPPVQEQTRIHTAVESQVTTIDELQKTANFGQKRADRLRQAILKRAFEGKLVPQDPNDEPASALLERIRAERAAHASLPRTRGRQRLKMRTAEVAP